MPGARVSAKGLIVADGALLCITMRDDEGDYFSLPGGGQEYGERLDEALRRECREELGVAVDVHELLWVRDYISLHHEFAAVEPETHSLELMFRCTLAPDAQPVVGETPDTDQIGVAWL